MYKSKYLCTILLALRTKYLLTNMLLLLSSVYVLDKTMRPRLGSAQLLNLHTASQNSWVIKGESAKGQLTSVETSCRSVPAVVILMSYEVHSSEQWSLKEV